ncbi:hypothetical protein Fcan01_22421 [Folsomia candida]|uniref:Uncharacterized protein n=1 Tax=Folsomia candida TaxID=158441 RepID=A0A226DEQ1_FOLCA|nr:hypothetical protein Fcan01_22421 [Folsomia candida]
MKPSYIYIILYLWVHNASGAGLRNGVIPAFNILLDNLISCDVQILHDGSYNSVDWFNVNLPVKILNMVKFNPHLKVEEVRVSPTLNLHHWITSATYGQFKYHELSDYDGSMVPHNVRCDDIVMTFVTTPIMRKWLGSVYFWTNVRHRISVIFISFENQVELCAWSAHLWDDDISVSYLDTNLICHKTAYRLSKREGSASIENIKNIATLSPGWCYEGQGKPDLKQWNCNAQQNPFNITQTQTRSETVMQIISCSVNETITFSKSCGSYTFRFEVESLIGPESLVTKTSGYQFLTCYRHEYITFELYITPYKPMMWLSLVISIITITVFMSLYKYYRGFGNISFAPWLFILATIFEETGHLPVKIGVDSICRLTLGSWCLVSVILTNCYNGIMISELNSPLRAFRPTLFDHLICERLGQGDMTKLPNSMSSHQESLVSMKNQNYSVLVNSPEVIFKHGYKRVEWYLYVLFVLANIKHMYTNDPYGNEHIRELKNPFASNKCFHLLSLSSRDVSGYPNFPEFLEYMYDYFWWNFRNEKQSSVFSKNSFLLVSLLDPRHVHHPTAFNYSNPKQTELQVRRSVEEELVDCGKSVLIVKSDEIEAEFQFVRRHYPSKEFYKGKEILRMVNSGWTFYDGGITKVPEYFKSLIWSGIYGRLQEEAMRRKYLHRTPTRKSEIAGLAPTVELGGTILTLFIICGAIFLLASFVLVIEIRVWDKPKLSESSYIPNVSDVPS